MTTMIVPAEKVAILRVVVIGDADGAADAVIVIVGLDTRVC